MSDKLNATKTETFKNKVGEIKAVWVSEFEIVREKTLRDEFAIEAMKSLMHIYWEMQDQYENGSALIKCHVETAYQYADAMMKERSK